MKKYHALSKKAAADAETMKRLSPEKHADFLKKLPCLICGNTGNAVFGVPQCASHAAGQTPDTASLAHNLRLISGNFEGAIMCLARYVLEREE